VDRVLKCPTHGPYTIIRVVGLMVSHGLYSSKDESITKEYINACHEFEAKVRKGSKNVLMCCERCSSCVGLYD